MSSSDDDTSYKLFHASVIRLHCTVSKELGKLFIFSSVGSSLDHRFADTRLLVSFS